MSGRGTRQPNGPFDLNRAECWTRIGASIISQLLFLAIFILHVTGNLSGSRSGAGAHTVQAAGPDVFCLVFVALGIPVWWGPVRLMRTRLTVGEVAQPRMLGLRGVRRLRWKDISSTKRGVLRGDHDRILLDENLFLDWTSAAREIRARSGREPDFWTRLMTTDYEPPRALLPSERPRTAPPTTISTALATVSNDAIRQPKLFGFAGEAVLHWADIISVAVIHDGQAGTVVTLRAPGKRIKLRLSAYEDPDAALNFILARAPARARVRRSDVGAGS